MAFKMKGPTFMKSTLKKYNSPVKAVDSSLIEGSRNLSSATSYSAPQKGDVSLADIAKKAKEVRKAGGWKKYREQKAKENLKQTKKDLYVNEETDNENKETNEDKVENETTPFKLKGSPFKRNFNVGSSPLKTDHHHLTTYDNGDYIRLMGPAGDRKAVLYNKDGQELISQSGPKADKLIPNLMKHRETKLKIAEGDASEIVYQNTASGIKAPRDGYQIGEYPPQIKTDKQKKWFDNQIAKGNAWNDKYGVIVDEDWVDPRSGKVIELRTTPPKESPHIIELDPNFEKGKGKGNWSSASEKAKSAGDNLTDLVNIRNNAVKGSNEYNKAQNKINEYYGVDKRYHVDEGVLADTNHKGRSVSYLGEDARITDKQKKNNLTDATEEQKNIAHAETSTVKENVKPKEKEELYIDIVKDEYRDDVNIEYDEKIDLAREQGDWDKSNKLQNKKKIELAKADLRATKEVSRDNIREATRGEERRAARRQARKDKRSSRKNLKRTKQLNK